MRGKRLKTEKLSRGGDRFYINIKKTLKDDISQNTDNPNRHDVGLSSLNMDKKDDKSLQKSTSRDIAQQTNVSYRTIERDEKFASAVDTLATNTGIDVQELLSGNIGKITKKDITTIAVEKTPEQQKKKLRNYRNWKYKGSQKEVKKGRS